MLIEGVILVHGEGMPGLRRFDVHGGVVQLDAGIQQLRKRLAQLGICHRAQSRHRHTGAGRAWR